MQYKRHGDHIPISKAFDDFKGLESELENSKTALDNAYQVI